MVGFDNSRNKMRKKTISICVLLALLLGVGLGVKAYSNMNSSSLLSSNLEILGQQSDFQDDYFELCCSKESICVCAGVCPSCGTMWEKPYSVGVGTFRGSCPRCGYVFPIIPCIQ